MSKEIPIMIDPELDFDLTSLWKQHPELAELGRLEEKPSNQFTPIAEIILMIPMGIGISLVANVLTEVIKNKMGKKAKVNTHDVPGKGAVLSIEKE